MHNEGLADINKDPRDIYGRVAGTIHAAPIRVMTGAIGLTLTCHTTVLVYMATNDDDKKRHRVREASHAYRLPEVRGRHQSHRAASMSKYDYDTPTSHLWTGSDTLPSSYAVSNRHVGHIQTTSPYSVIDFAMYVGIDDKQPVHFFTQLATDGKLDDLRITDTASWRRRLPEFEFLQPQMDDWSMQGREVLVCNASIKVMTESRPNASLSITFNLETRRDLSVFDSIECTTRFYDSGDMAADPQFDGRDAHDLKEHRTPCDYRTGPHGRSGCLRIAFGSKFWVNRMSKYQILRHRNESCISKSLLRLTATQDIYGIKPGTGEAEHLLTILWRFEQTRSSAEVGRMNWRVVNFDAPQPTALEQGWNGEKTESIMKMEDMHRGHEELTDCLTSAPHELSLYQQVSHLPLDYLQQPPPHGYAVQATHAQHPPQLHLDVLASMQPDLEHAHASAAPSASTDYSQHSISNLSHSRDTVGLYGQDPNDFDFSGGHITISGAFDPAMNLHEYDHMANQSAGLDGLHALVGLDQDGYNLGLACAAGNELVDVGVNHDLQDSSLSCYSTKPNLHHTNLISSLENQAEQYYTYVDHGQATHGHDGLPRHHPPMPGQNPALTQTEDFVSHGLHDAHINVNHGMWNLQSPFHEDTAGGASDGADCRKDSGVHGHGVGMGVLELIERDQRARGY
jgi:transcriptional enhancer factor